MSWILDKFLLLQSVFDSFTPQSPRTQTIDYTALKVVELKTLAKERGLKGYNGLRKAQLVEMLQQN